MQQIIMHWLVGWLISYLPALMLVKKKQTWKTLSFSYIIRDVSCYFDNRSLP